MTSRDYFSYTTLPTPSSIRLLQLHAGNSGQELKGSLKLADLEDDELDYEAVSYVWGSPELSQTIALDGGSVPITESLFVALQRFRLADHDRVLWIDQICIDQSSIVERNHQVTLMCQLYSRCSQCLAYLGPEADHSELVPSLIDAVWEFAIQNSNSEDPAWKRGPILSIHKIDGIPPSGDIRWGSFFNFMCRPWFRRLWILQEAVLPIIVKLVCGDWELDANVLYMFEKLASFYQIEPLIIAQHEDDEFTKFSKAWILLPLHMTLRLSIGQPCGVPKEGVPHKQYSMRELLAYGEYCEVTDSRDRFYALLGLANDVTTEPTLLPNYAKSLEEITISYNEFFIRSGQGAELLAGAWADPRKQCSHPQQPSWAPDWQAHPEAHEYGRVKSAELSADILEFNRGRWDSALTYISHLRISVRGFEVDQLRRTTTRVNDNSVEFVEEARSLAFDKVGDKWPQCSAELIWRTITGDHTHMRITPIPAGYYEVLEIWLKHKRDPKSLFDDMSDKASFMKQAEQDAYANLAIMNSKDTRFGITKTGRLGMFPLSSKPGDRIFMIDGGTRTFLTRYHADSDVYSWQSEVYIHGLDAQIKEITTSTEPSTIIVV